MLVSFVIPVFNEEQNIVPLHGAIREAAAGADADYEVIFVNDGSMDRTVDRIDEVIRKDGKVRGVCLSRNFGLQAAVSAGLSMAKGDAVMLIDGDMQDDPKHLPKFLEKWREGYKVVYAVRVSRKENFLKRMLFHWFYRAQHRLVDTIIPMDAGLFSLMDGRVVREMNQLREYHRYVPGLRAWVGFKSVGIPIERDPRAHGEPKMSLMKLFSMATDAIVSFTIKPLRLAIHVGFLMMICSMGVLGYVLYSKIFSHKAIAGWASTMTAIIVLFGMMFVIMGVLGEYVGRIYNEVKNRPVYIVDKVMGADEKDGKAG